MTTAAQSSFSNGAFLATEQLGEISDDQLFRRCQRYGDQARYWRQKFCGLLPEVNRRRLYEKKGFSGIYEFAAKLAGISHEQVDMVLRLEVRFENMPVLRTALVNGQVSVNKLARVVSIATPENQEELMEKVQMLSKSALEVLVRDEKFYQNDSWAIENPNGLLKAKNELKSLPGQTFTELELDSDVESELLELQHKGINVNELLREFLQKRKLKLAQEKEELAEEVQQQQKKLSRYIPAKIKQHLQKEYGTKCAKPACHKAAENIHHTARWSLSKNHDPRYLAPLCKAHHEVAHVIDAKVQEYRMARRW